MSMFYGRALYHSDVHVHATLQGSTESGKEMGAVPPCGVQPFRGLAYYIAPLGYMYPKPG